MRLNRCVVIAALQLPCGMIHRWPTVAECERMVERGEATRVRQPGKKSIGATRPVYRLVPRPEPSASIQTPPALSWKDTLLNLGIDPLPHRDMGLSRDRIREVRAKVRAYGMSSPRHAALA